MRNITFREEAQCEGWIEKIRTKSYAVASEPLLPADFTSPDLSSQLGPAFPLWTTNIPSFSSFKYTRARLKITTLVRKGKIEIEKERKSLALRYLVYSSIKSKENEAPESQITD